ncbi:gametocyte-specific factor 1-like [Chrysoperla carnea]|uniref:gametocyte-specific factor 1-like n=1 Tax=Chrysoperla carnea TaxID=189513 RepID=UPI001D06745E|nr:gametocyte-specific factor 1-like [Chrysoperla carnea]
MSAEMCICPYNKSHVVTRLRLPYHIIKCKARYPDIQLIHCPYNATHMVKKESMVDHLKECPDKVLIEPWKYNLNGTQQHGDLIPTTFNDEESVQNNYDDDDGWN